jgi:hypothetical protein
LNSTNLLWISQGFEEYPDHAVDCEQFVRIISHVMRRGGQNQGSDYNAFCFAEDFEERIVDLFFRANKERKETILFDELTSFLIEHEIETSMEGGGENEKCYVLNKDIRDKIPHNSTIDKIYYVEKLDKVLLYENSMKHLRIYNGPEMISSEKEEHTINCNGMVLAVEFIADRNAVAISLSDRTIVFHEISQKKLKKLP